MKKFLVINLIFILIGILSIKSNAIGCIGEWPNQTCTTSEKSNGISKEANNKKLVISFYELAINQHQPQEAANQYIGNKYIQHNPLVPDGKQGFVEFFLARIRQFPNLKASIKRVIAEGDLVVLHVHSQTSESDRGRAIIDIFRIENEKIVEHWDVIQAIPESSENNNGIFSNINSLNFVHYLSQ